MALTRQPSQSTDVCMPEDEVTPWAPGPGSLTGRASGSVGNQGLLGSLFGGFGLGGLFNPGVLSGAGTFGTGGGLFGDAGQDPTGRYSANGGFFGGSGITDGELGYSDMFGDRGLSVGSLGTGFSASGGGFYDPSSGAAEINGGFSSRTLTGRDIDYNANLFGGGLQANAGMGAVDIGSDFRGAAGWDPTNRHVYANASGDAGISGRDLYGDVNIGDGAFAGDASIGDIRYGYHADGNMSLGADGFHASTGNIDNLGQNGGVRVGGVQANNIEGGYSLGDAYSTRARIGHASNDVVVDNARLDIDGNGLNGSVEQVRAGGLRGQNMSVDTQYGPLSTHVGAGEVSNDVIVNNGRVSLNGSGLDASVDSARGGGIRGTNVNAGWGLWGQSGEFRAGDISNDHQISGANVHVDGNGMTAGLDHYRGGGIRGTNLSANQHLLGTDSHISAGEVSFGDTTLDGARFRRNLTGTEGEASFDKLEFGGFRVNDVNGGFSNETLGVSGDYGGSFATSDAIEGARANWDVTNPFDPRVSAHADKIGMPGWNLSNARVGLNGPMGTSASAKLEDLHSGFEARDVDARFNFDEGLRARVGHAQWDTLAGKNLDVNADLGPLYNANMHVGEGYYNRFSGDNINAGLDLTNGLTASGDNLQYGYVGFNDIRTQSSMFGGFQQQHLNADSARGLGVDVGHLNYQNTGLNQSLDAQNVHAYGADIRGLDYGQSMGDANMGVSADRLAALDLTVGDLHSRTSMMGLEGNGSVNNANLDVLNVQNGHVGLGYGDQELLGARGDYRAGLGVEHADANWNLLGGTANAQFQNARMGQQLNNASVNLFGNEIALPDMGYNVNASGGANMDLSRGAANANLSLAGSSVNFAGTELTLGDWAQASGGVDLSRGAANANLGGENGLTAGVDLSQGAANLNVGGENGVGADVNLSEGNLDLNVFGTKIDVDQGLRDAWDFATSW